jgi:hypothetical protein
MFKVCEEAITSASTQGNDCINSLDAQYDAAQVTLLKFRRIAIVLHSKFAR